MKLSFLILLLANVLFFVWTYWFDSEPAPPPTPRIGAPTLTLASELPPLPEPTEDSGDAAQTGANRIPENDERLVAETSPEGGSEAVGLPGQSDADAGSAGTRAAVDAPDANRVGDAEVFSSPTELALSCASLGPFRTEDDAGNAAARLAAEGFSPLQRTAEMVVGGGYWVHLPPYPTRAAAQRVVTEINAGGVPDAYIVRTGEDINAIALGLLTELERAQRLAEEVRAIGFDAQIAERTLTDTVYWVDVEVDDIARIDPTQFQSSPDRIARLRIEDCPAPDPLQLD